MEICLHVGAHRTGTTSLQMLLQRGRSRLERHDAAFWGPQLTRSGLFRGLIKNPDTMTGLDMDMGQRSCGRISMELQRLGHVGTKTLIVSEENMIGTMAENLASRSLYGQAEARLGRFAPAFAGRRPHIWLSIRSYELHWASQLAFRIKTGAPVPSSADIDLLSVQMRDWQSVVRSVQWALPDAKITVWRFEDWISRPAALLARLLGTPAPLGAGMAHLAGAPANASASAAQLARLAQDRGDKPAADHLAAHSQGSRYMPFNLEQRAGLQHLYRDDLDWLRAGADGIAQYLDPAEDTFGGYDMTEGSPYERQEASVASPR